MQSRETEIDVTATTNQPGFRRCCPCTNTRACYSIERKSTTRALHHQHAAILLQCPSRSMRYLRHASHLTLMTWDYLEGRKLIAICGCVNLSGYLARQTDTATHAHARTRDLINIIFENITACQCLKTLIHTSRVFPDIKRTTEKLWGSWKFLKGSSLWLITKVTTEPTWE